LAEGSSFNGDKTNPLYPRIIAIANQKGGVGKTTTAINLGTALAAIGENVLLVDLDPQGNASTGLGISKSQRSFSTYDIFVRERKLSDVIQQTAIPRLAIAPATQDLLGVEIALSQATDRANKLKLAIQSYADMSLPRDRFSYILFDCPPSLNILTINALAAARSVLVPLQCEFFALEGLSQLLSTVEQVRAALNPVLSIQGIVLTMYDPRNSLSAQVAADARSYLGDKVYGTVIPRNVRISEAPSYGKPVLLYDLKCAGSQAYLKLASEIIQREANCSLTPFVGAFE
jgi:chromosome partitioning protein